MKLSIVLHTFGQAPASKPTFVNFIILGITRFSRKSCKTFTTDDGTGDDMLLLHLYSSQKAFHHLGTTGRYWYECLLLSMTLVEVLLLPVVVMLEGALLQRRIYVAV